jgi:hypothetical protein
MAMKILFYCSETSALPYGLQISKQNQHQNEKCIPHFMRRLFTVDYTLISVFNATYYAGLNATIVHQNLKMGHGKLPIIPAM